MKYLAPLLALTLLAQDPVIKVEVELINILCSVRNKQGGLVGNLEKTDFQIFEDGKEQEIKHFARETDLPLTIGLLVDTSKSQERLIEIERNAARKFFAQVLGKKDVAFLIQFGKETELLQDVTNSQKLLARALDELRLDAPVGGLHPGPVPTMSRNAGTVLYDAVYLAAAEKLRREVGRKALVVITDGMDFGSRYSRDQAIEQAHKSDAIIYGIWYVDQRAYGGGFGMGGGGFGGASDSALKKMAEETGGRVFHVGGKTPLEEIFRQIQEEMRTQYAVAYSSTNPKKDGSFRKLDVRAKNKDLKVQARKGYFADSN
jgi:VWFA-related protein